LLKLVVSDFAEEFRSELRRWLSFNPPPSISLHSALEVFIDESRAWQKQLAASGWVGVHWPSEYGGRSLSLVEEAIVQEEMVRVQAPQLLGLFGLTMVGPVLIQHGTTDQKKRFLPDILDATSIWCQGFSEPGAGSDLAAIRTRATATDGGFRVEGQKVWTSFAQIADWCFALCRTSEEEKKHHGLTYMLMDMRSPGISVRPLKQITGDDEFNEVFFDDVFLPSENVVGEIGQGWNIAISTLMYERVILTFARQLQSENCLRQLIDFSSHDDLRVPLKRRSLSSQIARACAIRALAYEHLTDYAGGKKPGPEGSIDKLLWSESFQEISKLAFSWNAVGAAGGEEGRGSQMDREAAHRYLYSRGRTIAAGTSEIQRSLIAERILGLPRLKYS